MSKRAKDHKKFTVKTLRTLAKNIEDQKFDYDPRDFKLAIIEASQGSTGTVSLSDKVLLYCFDFDPVGKKYALRALNVMKLGGAITLFAIIIMMGFLWLRKNKGEQ